MSAHSDHEDGPPNAPARESRPEAPPSETQPHDARGGTTIQKVEIVITSNESPGRIARLIEERLRKLANEWRFHGANPAKRPTERGRSPYLGELWGGDKCEPTPEQERASNPRVTALRSRHAAILAYLHEATAEADWHAVSDAANDLRCVEAELRCLGAEP